MNSCPSTKEIKEGFLGIAFDVAQGKSEVVAMSQMLQKNIDFLSHSIARRKYRIKKECLGKESFNSVIMQVHQSLRSILQANMDIYRQMDAQMEVDLLKISDELRKVVLMRTHERHEYMMLTQKYETSKVQSKKVLEKFEELAKKKYIYRLEENFRHEGEPQRSEEELDILKNITKEISFQIDETKDEQQKYKEKVACFWVFKTKEYAQKCSHLMNLFDKIVKVKPYENRLNEIKSNSNCNQAYEDMADLKYVPIPGDQFDPKNVQACGVDLLYTGLCSDKDLPEEKRYCVNEDLENLDEKVEENKSQKEEEGRQEFI